MEKEQTAITHLTDIVSVIANQTGLPKNKTKAVIESTFNYIKDELSSGKDVSIYRMGRFKRVSIGPIDQFKPNTHDMIHIPKHTVVHFAKSPNFKL